MDQPDIQSAVDPVDVGGPIPPGHWAYPDLTNIQTEDGAPVDSLFTEKQMRLLTSPLWDNWHPEDPFAVYANVGLWLQLKIPAIVPDVMLAFHDPMYVEETWTKESQGFFIWDRSLPHVVIEIVSRTPGGELDKKKKRYADLRILHYVVWDPKGYLSQTPLRYFALVAGGYEEGPMPTRSLAGVGLTLKTWKGKFEDWNRTWLRWCDGDGNLIPTAAEMGQVQKENLQREARRADQATQRADQLQADRDRMAALLKAAGIDPDA